ncbi:ABC transporter transmembrane domain-containing protein [Blautia stercoris]
MIPLGTSTLINRMTNDINQVQNGINMFLRLFLRSPFVVFGCYGYGIYGRCKKLRFLYVIVIPALAVVVFAILLITMPLYKNVQKQLDDVLLSTRENLLGIRVVRAFKPSGKVKWNHLEKKAAGFSFARFTSEKFLPC